MLYIYYIYIYTYIYIYIYMYIYIYILVFLLLFFLLVDHPLNYLMSLLKLPATSAIFRIALFEAVLSTSVGNCLAWSIFFWQLTYLDCHYHLTFHIFLMNIFSHTFGERQQSITFYKYLISMLSLITSHFYMLNIN